MKNEKLKALSNEALIKQQKLVKTAVSILIGALAVMFCVTIIKTIIGSFTVVNILPIVFIPVFIFNLNNLREIKKEVATRKLA